MAEWDGLDAVLASIERVATQADMAAKAIVAQSAAVVEAKAKANFSGSHKKGEPHVGGDKPNIVTGTLRRSIRADPVTRRGVGDYGTTVAPRVIYARRVELGYSGTHDVTSHTRKVKGGDGRVRKITVRAHSRTHAANEDGSNKGAYPYWEPAVRDSMPKLLAIQQTQWAKFLRL
jgi:hypothetical protein